MPSLNGKAEPTGPQKLGSVSYSRPFSQRSSSPSVLGRQKFNVDLFDLEHSCTCVPSMWVRGSFPRRFGAMRSEFYIIMHLCLARSSGALAANTHKTLLRHLISRGGAPWQYGPESRDQPFGNLRVGSL